MPCRAPCTNRSSDRSNLLSTSRDVPHGSQFPNVLESRGTPIISPATGGEHRVRTKAALAAAKAKGVKLGGDRGNLAARNAAKKAKANKAAAKVVDIIRPLREQGASLQAIADRLTAMGVGSNWSPTKVKRTLERLA